MIVQIGDGHRLYQETIVRKIMNECVREHVYKNANGNWAISKEVLKEFRLLSEDDFVWECGDRAWRRKRPTDKPGRAVD
jgi:hypothetical protein